ncbi:muscarinic acetylcholine receptor M1-like [Diadema setosum]|uniref:muscarinic acetylcholine receptor M1-like n=1 Tax=Diadema setosum TaxID=31175 RepID=UPI003B3AF6AF
MVLIIAANGMTLAAFCVEKRLRTYNNYFVVNLAILDLIIGLLLPVGVAHSFLGRYPFSKPVCRVLGGIKNGITNVSNVTVVVICVDRHRATFDPINHFMSRSKRKATLSISLTWLIFMTFWLLYYTAWEFINDFDNGDHCIHWDAYNSRAFIFSMILIFYLPFVLVAVLYLQILRKIVNTLGGKSVGRKFDEKKAEISANDRTSDEFLEEEVTSAAMPPVVVAIESTKGKEVEHNSPETATRKDRAAGNKPVTKRESMTESRKATRTLLFIILSFVVTWLPISLIDLLYTIEPRLIVPGLSYSAYIFFGWMRYANSLLNPLAYAATQPLLRATILDILRCGRCWKVVPP